MTKAQELGTLVHTAAALSLGLNRESPRDIASRAIATSTRYGKPVVLTYSEPVARELFNRAFEVVGSTERQEYLGEGWAVTLQRQPKN